MQDLVRCGINDFHGLSSTAVVPIQAVNRNPVRLVILKIKVHIKRSAGVPARGHPSRVRLSLKRSGVIC